MFNLYKKPIKTYLLEFIINGEKNPDHQRKEGLSLSNLTKK